MKTIYIILLAIVVIAVSVLGVPLLFFGLIYAVTIPIGLIYAFNAESWLDMHGMPFSYTRGLRNGFMGIFYVHNYYHQAFKTYSLDIFDPENVAYKEPIAEDQEQGDLEQSDPEQITYKEPEQSQESEQDQQKIEDTLKKIRMIGGST